MKLRELKKHLQEKHGYWNVEYNSRGPKEWKYDPFTGEDYGYCRSRYKLRVTTTYRTTWRESP